MINQPSEIIEDILEFVNQINENKLDDELKEGPIINLSAYQYKIKTLLQSFKKVNYNFEYSLTPKSRMNDIELMLFEQMENIPSEYNDGV